MNRPRWEWEKSVEGIMREKGLPREDAPFVYDLEHGLLEWDEAHLAKVMRIYRADRTLAALTLGLATKVYDPPRDRPATRPFHVPRKKDP